MQFLRVRHPRAYEFLTLSRPQLLNFRIYLCSLVFICGPFIPCRAISKWDPDHTGTFNVVPICNADGSLIPLALFNFATNCVLFEGENFRAIFSSVSPACTT